MKSERMEKTVHPKESRGDCYIRQNKLKEKKKCNEINCIMIQWSIYRKAVTSKNIYASNIRYLRKMKQTLRERKTNSGTGIVRDFNAQVEQACTDHTAQQKHKTHASQGHIKHSL